jgi:hypothetical protein
MLGVWAALLLAGPLGDGAPEKAASLRLTAADYQDRVPAAWAAHILAVLLAGPHERNIRWRKWISDYPKPYSVAPVDDHWYHEMVALRGFREVLIHPSRQRVVRWSDRGTARPGPAAKETGTGLDVPFEEVETQPAGLFPLADLTAYWNPEWKLLQRVLLAGKTAGNAYWRNLRLSE